MAQIALKLLFLVVFQSGLLTSAQEPTVTVEQGTLRGRTLTSNSVRNIFSFQGIPYAAPPIGELRFKPPQAAPSWNGEKAAIQSITLSCPQINYITQQYEGQEDCLYLNVYTPKLEHEGSGLSVMVWFHGGGFFSGSGSTIMYGPELLLDEDIILVTINYRLGVFGFLSLNTKNVSGNYGLKDQVAALRWVKQNIQSFGGNPNSVTIFGQSAGGSSVHYLMLSPLARGLFHRAIAQSASAYSDWAFERTPVAMAHALAAKLHCATDEETLMGCLNEADGKRLEELSHIIKMENNIPTVFAPSVEPADTENAFLVADPVALIERGEIADVPFMTGLMTHESIYRINELAARNITPEEDLRLHYKNYVPSIFGIDKNSADFEVVWQKIKTFYEQLYPNNPLERFIILSSDVDFVIGVDELVRKLAALQRSPIYYYQFSYDGTLSLIKTLSRLKYNGTCHGDELAYMFTGPVYPPWQSASNQDRITSSRLIKMWTNFAKIGNPTPDSSLAVEWNAVEANSNEISTRYLDINTQLVMKNENLNNIRVNFWRKLLYQYQQTK